MSTIGRSGKLDLARDHRRIVQGNLWHRMNGQPRSAAVSLTGKDVPTGPGVYAWYRQGEHVYSGRALGCDGLHGRIWKNHLKTGNDLSRSSFRRNVCEHLGIAHTSKTTVRPTVVTAADIEPVNRWIRECEVAWIECQSASEAEALEKALHAEWMRPSLDGDSALDAEPVTVSSRSGDQGRAMGAGVSVVLGQAWTAPTRHS